MKTAWVDLDALNAAVRAAVPDVRVYHLPHSSIYPATEFRRTGRDGKTAHGVTIFANGETLGAWPIKTKTDRKLMMTVLVELDRQYDEAKGKGEG